MKRSATSESGTGTALKRAAVRDPFDCVRVAHFAQDDRKAPSPPVTPSEAEGSTRNERHAPARAIPFRGASCALVTAAALLVSGCTTTVTRVDYADVAGRPCELLKAKADWYSAEASTTCIDGDGQPIMIATQHTDLSMLTAAGAILAAIITVGFKGL